MIKMREILFRAKRKDNNEWVYGYIIKSYLNNAYFMTTDEDTTKNYWESKPLQEVIPETISQYIGLTDKNGVKIFENDIIQVFDTTGEASEKLKIKWDSNMGSYEVLTLNDYHYSYDTKCAIAGCKVIGNIFDEEVIK